MSYANQADLVCCTNCNALYNRKTKWAKGYYEGTSMLFQPIAFVKEGTCPICGEKNE
jgi:RNA polymerase subunit RPABC4/transcription elongation factor Spt4